MSLSYHFTLVPVAEVALRITLMVLLEHTGSGSVTTGGSGFELTETVSGERLLWQLFSSVTAA